MNPDRSSTSFKPGLYVHIPFCSSICPYCDFAVLTGDRSRQERFVTHLLREIELADEGIRGFDTVYFGPQLLAQLRLLDPTLHAAASAVRNVGLCFPRPLAARL